jgi:hypothetical protein
MEGIWCQRFSGISSALPGDSAALAVPVGADLDISRALGTLPTPLGGGDGSLARAAERDDARGFLVATGFRGHVGEAQSLLLEGHHVLAVGISPADETSRPGAGRDAKPSRDDLRRAGAALARAASRVRSVATTLHGAGDDTEIAAQAVAEGIVLAGYRYRPSPSGQRAAP